MHMFLFLITFLKTLYDETSKKTSRIKLKESGDFKVTHQAPCYSAFYFSAVFCDRRTDTMYENMTTNTAGTWWVNFYNSKVT